MFFLIDPQVIDRKGDMVSKESGLDNANSANAEGGAMQEQEQVRITHEQFQQAAKVFAEDLKIVDHPNEPLTSLLSEPNQYGTYSLTQVEGLTENDLMQEVSGREVVVYIGCMDKRVARPTYDLIKQRHPNAVILTLTMGGGIIQEDVIKRPNSDGGIDDVPVNRGHALKTQLQYLDQLLTQHAGSFSIIATGHDCKCGACKFYNADVAVHERLQTEKGSQEEQDEMALMIREHTEKHVPVHLIEKGNVQMLLVHVDEDNQAVELINL